MDSKDVNNIVNEIKSIDGNVTGVIVPILRDTVADYRKIVFKLIITIIILIIGIVSVSVTAQVIISKQIKQYNDFLSQFEFESDETIYQDLDSGEGGSATVNSGINYTSTK